MSELSLGSEHVSKGQTVPYNLICHACEQAIIKGYNQPCVVKTLPRHSFRYDYKLIFNPALICSHSHIFHMSHMLSHMLLVLYTLVCASSAFTSVKLTQYEKYVHWVKLKKGLLNEDPSPEFELFVKKTSKELPEIWAWTNEEAALAKLGLDVPYQNPWLKVNKLDQYPWELAKDPVKKKQLAELTHKEALREGDEKAFNRAFEYLVYH